MKIEPIYVCLDTNQFIQCSYNFTAGKLKNLKMYCDQGLVKLLITEVIIQEIKSHIKDDLCEFYDARKKELTKARVLSSIRNNNSYKYIFETIDVNVVFSLMDIQMEEYINDKNVIVLDNSLIDIDNVINAYFNIDPPFEKTKKRNEFKDAFIINAIKNFCIKNKVPVHIISADIGFIKCFENKEDYIIHNEISDFFKFMNEKCHKEIYEQLESYIKLPIIGRKINDETESYLDDCSITIIDEQQHGVINMAFLDDVKFSNISYSKLYFEETDGVIIAHMELNCYVNVRYDISDSYVRRIYENTQSIAYTRSQYFIIENFDITFGVNEELGGLYIEIIEFNNYDLILDERSLVNSSIHYE